MARILKPGGRAVVVDLLRHDREDFALAMGQQHLGFSPEVLARAMADAGLRGVSARALPPEPGAKGPALILLAGERAARARSRNQSRRVPEGGRRR
jgi:ArsR family transcriptional regulator